MGSLVDLVGIEPTTSPAGRGALGALNASSQSASGLRDETSNSSIAVRDGALQQLSRTPRDRQLPKVPCRVLIGSVRVGAPSIDFRHPRPIRYRTVRYFDFSECKRLAYREVGGPGQD